MGPRNRPPHSHAASEKLNSAVRVVQIGPPAPVVLFLRHAYRFLCSRLNLYIGSNPASEFSCHRHPGEASYRSFGARMLAGFGDGQSRFLASVDRGGLKPCQLITGNPEPIPLNWLISSHTRTSLREEENPTCPFRSTMAAPTFVQLRAEAH